MSRPPNLGRAKSRKTPTDSGSHDGIFWRKNASPMLRLSGYLRRTNRYFPTFLGGLNKPPPRARYSYASAHEGNSFSRGSAGTPHQHPSSNRSNPNPPSSKTFTTLSTFSFLAISYTYYHTHTHPSVFSPPRHHLPRPEAKTILKNIISSKSSDYTVIAGPSGSGKSALLKEIAAETQGVVYVSIPPIPALILESRATKAFSEALNGFQFRASLVKRLLSPSSTPSTVPEYLQFNKVYEDFTAFAARFKAEHGRNVVLVFDNVDILADHDPEFLAALQGNAKVAADEGSFRVVFVCDSEVTVSALRPSARKIIEFVGPRILELQKVCNRLDDGMGLESYIAATKREAFEDFMETGGRVDKDRAINIARGILQDGPLEWMEYHNLCGGGGEVEGRFLERRVFAVDGDGLHGFESKVVENAVRERFGDGAVRTIS
ncbi:hypothetical protein K440DRAFT_643415 [Wilcoxina mikolae CBS 423.85]|nr:hypothetical protein K440DRAFT_643415 [Wilcoxina mikolae CBS 423.85]